MARTRDIRGLVGLIAAAAVYSCAGPGNTGKDPPNEKLQRDVPWLNAGIPALNAANLPIIPTEPVYPPIRLGLPDPGSQRADCSGLNGLEFATTLFSTFEPNPTDLTRTSGGAEAWAGFDDRTPGAFHVPGDVSWYDGLGSKVAGAWGLPADRIDGPSCDGKPNQWALHFRGGPFRWWGGGVSHVFTDPDGRCTLGDELCLPLPPVDATEDSVGIPLAPVAGGMYAQSHTFIDGSKYEGIAFWARRGPDSQERLLVTVTDNFTSARLARENQKYCRRIRECRTRCDNGLPCTPVVDPGDMTTVYRCFDPSTGPFPFDNGSCPAPGTTRAQVPGSRTDLMYPRCGPSACTSPCTYVDPDFDKTECRPYTFPAADESGEYCFNADEPPPSRDDRCLDGWQGTVGLTLDWQFYILPFSELRQGGYGKRAPYFNLKAIDTVAFTFIVGWADAYVDNVTLYRHKK